MSLPWLFSNLIYGLDSLALELSNRPEPEPFPPCNNFAACTACVRRLYKILRSSQCKGEPYSDELFYLSPLSRSIRRSEELIYLEPWKSSRFGHLGTSFLRGSSATDCYRYGVNKMLLWQRACTSICMSKREMYKKALVIVMDGHSRGIEQQDICTKHDFRTVNGQESNWW